MATFANFNNYATTDELSKIKKDINRIKRDFKKFIWKSNTKVKRK